MGKAAPSGLVLSVFSVVYGLLNWGPIGGTGSTQNITGRCVGCASCDVLLQRFKSNQNSCLSSSLDEFWPPDAGPFA